MSATSMDITSLGNEPILIDNNKNDMNKSCDGLSKTSGKVVPVERLYLGAYSNEEMYLYMD